MEYNTPFCTYFPQAMYSVQQQFWQPVGSNQVYAYPTAANTAAYAVPVATALPGGVHLPPFVHMSPIQQLNPTFAFFPPHGVPVPPPPPTPLPPNNNHQVQIIVQQGFSETLPNTPAGATAMFHPSSSSLQLQQDGLENSGTESLSQAQSVTNGHVVLPSGVAATNDANAALGASGNSQDLRSFQSQAADSGPQPNAPPATMEEILQEMPNPPHGQIIINYLDAAVNTTELNALFFEFGHILGSKIMYDDQNQSKGYGFVYYELPMSAASAILKRNGVMYRGKKLKVHWSKKPNQRFMPRE